MGRPSLLTPERAAAICNAVERGASATEASAAGDVSKSAVLAWLDRGRTERARIATDPDEEAQPSDQELPYVEFLANMEKSADTWVMGRLEEIQAAGAGEEYEETTVVEKVGGWDGSTRDERGAPVLHPIEQTVTVKKGRKKSWQAAAWLLERRRPEDFARLVKTELTGADGGPIELESLEAKRARARALVQDELSRKREQKGIMAPIDVESTEHEIFDAELVEDELPAGTLLEALATGQW